MKCCNSPACAKSTWAVKNVALATFAASPRARFTVEEMVGMGDRCVVRWRYEWVDDGGQPGHVRGIDLFRARDGLLVEKLSYVKG